MVGGGPCLLLAAGVTSLLQVGCPARRVGSWGAGTPAQQSPCPAGDLQAAWGWTGRVWIPRPGLVSRGAAASKEVKQAVGVLTGALAWTQSWAWPTGCVACREWGLEAPWRTGTSPVHVRRLAGELHVVGLGPPRPSGPGEPLPLPGLWEPDGHTWLPGGGAW